MEIKNLKKAANRLKKAIRRKERIILYGDADVDGITSVIIVKESVQSLGGVISAIYFPNRAKQGYGLNEIGLRALEKYSPGLLITLDCGISNFKEVELAKKMGFEVLIIDHHEVLDKLPKASIIVNPKQKGDKYPFKEFSTGALALKFTEALFGKAMSNSLRNNFLELASLSIIADMMPEEEDNKIIVEQGLPLLQKSFRPGIQALGAAVFEGKNSDLRRNVSEIISILNIRNAQEGLSSAFLLLTCADPQEADSLVREFLQEHRLKKERIKEIVDQVQVKAAIQENQPIIFAGSTDWELILLGSVASIICKQTQKPVFLFAQSEKESQGSVRAPQGINSVALMKKCQKYLISFGGHPPASGFGIKNENLEKFKQCLMRNCEK